MCISAAIFEYENEEEYQQSLESEPITNWDRFYL